MIDKVTFVICLIKLVGLQIILLGVFFGLLTDAPIYAIIVCIGSLVFATGSNVLLAINIKLFRTYRKEREKNGES